jgi:hypothetical protein
MDNAQQQKRQKQQEPMAVSAAERQWVLLSGLGFYRLSKQRRQQLWYVFIGTVVVHVVGMLVFGGWIIMRTRTEKATVFTVPPPSKTYEPRKLEHQVKIQKRQRSSSRPSMVPRLVSMKTSQLALPDIKLDPKIVHTTFQPKFKAVSGKGLGAGLGTGYGTHGFGPGVSSFNFFGIHSKGEKIAVLMDASVSMAEEEKGGVAGYWRVKERCGQVIDSFNEGTLFNVIVFGDAAKTMEKEMVIASPDNKRRAKTFIQPFNTEGNWGLTTGNVQASAKGLRAAGGTTRLDLALTAAFLNGADTILVISDGIPRVRKTWSAEAMQGFENQRRQWMTENAAAQQAWDTASAAANATAVETAERVWIPETPAVPARPPSKQPPKEGQAPDMGSPARPAIPGHWEVRTHRSGGWQGAPRPAPPPTPDPGWWTLADFVEHLTILHTDLYIKQGKKPPAVHCIGYQIDDEGSAFLQDLSKQYHGQYRRVRSLK